MDNMLATPTRMRPPSTSRDATKPRVARSLCSRTTGNRTTAVPTEDTARSTSSHAPVQDAGGAAGSKDKVGAVLHRLVESEGRAPRSGTSPGTTRRRRRRSVWTAALGARALRRPAGGWWPWVPPCGRGVRRTPREGTQVGVRCTHVKGRPPSHATGTAESRPGAEGRRRAGRRSRHRRGEHAPAGATPRRRADGAVQARDGQGRTPRRNGRCRHRGVRAA